MCKFVELMKRLKRDERGATIVEYGLALTIVAAIGATVLTSIGTEPAARFSTADQMLQSANPDTTTGG